MPELEEVWAISNRKGGGGKKKKHIGVLCFLAASGKYSKLPRVPPFTDLTDQPNTKNT